MRIYPPLRIFREIHGAATGSCHPTLKSGNPEGGREGGREAWGRGGERAGARARMQADTNQKHKN